MPRPNEITKKEILETATRLFNEKGWDKVNIEDVVKSLGVTRGAFYHYFNSREDLIYACIDKVFSDNNPFIDISKRQELNALEKMRLMVKINDDLLGKSVVNEFQKTLDNPTLFKSEIFSQVNTVAPFLEKLLADGNKDGSMSVKYPKQTAQILCLMNVWLNFDVPEKEFADKISFYGHLAESLGIPIMTDEIESDVKKRFRDYRRE
ncbi:MAG: TetR/AcrR family transcriptional regulator [Firmicutes bacterium]|nr:TetR/AcrR family transcriptional regulator [Bacillota bacterium]